MLLAPPAVPPSVCSLTTSERTLWFSGWSRAPSRAATVSATNRVTTVTHAHILDLISPPSLVPAGRPPLAGRGAETEQRKSHDERNAENLFGTRCLTLRTISIKTRSLKRILGEESVNLNRASAAPFSDGAGPAATTRGRCGAAPQGSAPPSAPSERGSPPLAPSGQPRPCGGRTATSPPRAAPSPRRRRSSGRSNRRKPAFPPSFPGCARRSGARAGAGGCGHARSGIGGQGHSDPGPPSRRCVEKRRGVPSERRSRRSVPGTRGSRLRRARARTVGRAETG